MKATRWLVGVSVMLMLGLAGCENTVHGFGKDMEKAGEKIQSSGTSGTAK